MKPCEAFSNFSFKKKQGLLKESQPTSNSSTKARIGGKFGKLIRQGAEAASKTAWTRKSLWSVTTTFRHKIKWAIGEIVSRCTRNA